MNIDLKIARLIYPNAIPYANSIRTDKGFMTRFQPRSRDTAMRLMEALNMDCDCNSNDTHKEWIAETVSDDAGEPIRGYGETPPDAVYNCAAEYVKSC